MEETGAETVSSDSDVLRGRAGPAKAEEAQRNQQDAMPDPEDRARCASCPSAGFPGSPWRRCLVAVMGAMGGRRRALKKTEVGFGGGGCTNQELSVK